MFWCCKSTNYKNERKKLSDYLAPKNLTSIFALPNGNDSVAQLVEQYTFNVWVLGSNPSRITLMKALPLGMRFFLFQHDSELAQGRGGIEKSA
jgi:hypothetical protein